MSLKLWLHRAPALITTGDAVNSFLTQPDETTSGLCLFSGASMYLHWEWRMGSFESSLQWKKIKERKLASLILPVYKPEPGLISLFLTIGSDGNFTLAVDAPVGKTLLPLHLSLFTPALLANLAQVLISYIYITFNNLFTCMLAGQEWMQFATRRQPLRVTSPIAQQRSTYLLKLPYHYSLPLLAISSVLSWLVSQSLFVVSVAVRDKGQLLPPNYMFSRCGYSPGAITLTLTVSAVLAFASIAVELRRDSMGMPLAAICSGAISAACHPSADEQEVAVLPVL
ncbi:MAG: hypothetical protein Q9221_007717 [Calogaya cf. arnoldii]